MPNVPISIGELFDKYSILEIKSARMKSNTKHVIKELSYLKPFVDVYPLDFTYYEELKKTNELLWDIEDKIREKERKKEFDSEFIKLARDVYMTNDKRCEIKKNINELLNSDLYEVKEYVEYK